MVGLFNWLALLFRGFLQGYCLEFGVWFEVSMCRIYGGNLTNRLGVMLVLCVSHLGNDQIKPEKKMIL